MSRSGYNDYDADYPNAIDLWRGAVDRAIGGKRGQAFLRELGDALDALPVKRLVKNQFENGGEVCTLGAIAARRGVRVDDIDPEDDWYCADVIAKRLGIARSMAAEIMFENDEANWRVRDETPEQRFERMRRWVEENIKRD